MRELIIATRNEKKGKELAAFLQGLPLKFRTLKDYPQIPEIKETGQTFLANAKRKALCISRWGIHSGWGAGALTLADDSGLVVEALGGAPGVYSARFAGPQKSDRDNIDKLLSLLRDVPEGERQAEFVCAIVIADRGRIIETIQERCKGKISFAPEGGYGFGYDPVFIVPKFNKTFAQLGARIKNKISHRAKALFKAQAFLKSYLKRD